jgi:hypothetical protein
LTRVAGAAEKASHRNILGCGGFVTFGRSDACYIHWNQRRNGFKVSPSLDGLVR